MKLYIDASLCSGHGRCYTLAPDLVQPDEEGFPVTSDGEVDVPDGSGEAARQIVANCPEGAIRLLS